MDYLSKPGSQYLYRLAQEAEEAAREYRRQLQLEQARAGAANFNMSGTQSPAPPAPVASTPQVTTSGDDTMQRLAKLKQLRENDLITEEEFQARKREILADI